VFQFWFESTNDFTDPDLTDDGAIGILGETQPIGA
jgi:hypothetical protein